MRVLHSLSLHGWAAAQLQVAAGTFMDALLVWDVGGLRPIRLTEAEAAARGLKMEQRRWWCGRLRTD